MSPSRRMLRACLALSVSLPWAAVPEGPSVSVNASVSYTDNLFQSSSRRADWVTRTYLDLDFAPRRDVGLYYTGNTSVFSEYDDLFTHRHALGLGYARPSGTRGAVYTGLDLSAFLYRPVYDLYDHRQASAYVAGKGYGPDGTLGRAGLEVRYREYPNAGEYTHLEFSTHAQLQRSWQSGTTVQARGELGVKRFTRDASFDSAAVGSRMTDARTLTQLTGRIKLAQAIGRQTGLQLLFIHRANLAGSNRTLTFDSYFEDLIDDRYSHSGSEYRVVLKHVGHGGVELQATGRHLLRNYDDRPALELDGELVDGGVWREDRRNLVHLRAKKALPFAHGWPLLVHAEWLYQQVDSNDPYYDASTRVYSTGVEIEF